MPANAFASHKRQLCVKAEIMPHVFEKLERALGEKLPGDLELILKNTGFDRESTLLGINSKNIDEIQNYLNENKFLLQNTVYEHCFSNDSVFTLKPGHRALLLSIPKVLSEEKPSKAKKNHKNKENQATSRVEQEISEQDLVNAILRKVVKYADRKNFEINTDLLEVHDINRVGSKVQCKLQCPLCAKQIKCYFGTYWNISNFQDHFKKHFITVETVLIDYTEDNSDAIDEIIQE